MSDSISKIEIITRKSNFEELKTALNEIGVMGMTVSQVLGCGTQKGDIQYYRGVPMELKLLPKIKLIPILILLTNLISPILLIF